MKERLSALVDDALDEDSAIALLQRLRSDEEAMRDWRTYQLIGDSIRGDADVHVDLVAKVMARIESEPTVLAPTQRQRASAKNWRWALPLAASVMGVGAVAWVAQTLQRQTAPAEAVARLAPPEVGAISNVPPRLGSLESAAQSPNAGGGIPMQASFGREYLIAHQAQSPGASLSGVAQYVRTVSESRYESAR